jgi:hypothetical protein
MAINDNYKDSTSLKSRILSLLSLSSARPTHGLLLTLVGPVLSGFFVYFILSSLATPLRISAPLSIVISIIIFGLSSHYGKERVSSQYRNSRSQIGPNKSILNFFFVAIYLTSIIFTFLSQDNSQIFVSWQKVAALDLVKLGFAIGISVFMPGYALIISILDRKSSLGYLPIFLLSYIFSIIITGLSAYITASMGLAFSNFNSIFGTINLVILGLFVYIKILDKHSLTPFDHVYLPNISFFWESIKTKIPELVVFTGLFMLVVISTYYLYSGTIIGDEWVHHGRALEVLNNTYRDYSLLGLNVAYPPLFSSFLAGFFDLSGVPTVNAYVSINFLNFMPIIAFYYFFVKWVPTKKRAALLATALFTLSSGFGWIYVLNLAAHDYSGLTSAAVLNIFHLAAIKTFDISVPNTFINVAHPDITTSLIVISLPAGFVLLGLVREKMAGLRYVSIIALMIFVYLFHQEFGLFVIVAIILYLIFERDRGNYFFIGALIGFSVISLVAIFSPDDTYRSQTKLGIPLIAIYFLLILSTLALYSSKILYKHLPIRLPRIFSRRFDRRLVRFILGVSVVSLVSYLYILSFIVWDNQLNTFDIRIHTNEFHIVPWHFYPLRLGVVGLLGLAYILSFMFRRFEKEVIVFGVLAIVAFAVGSNYDEQRLNKYIMAAMAGFASLLIYEILLAVHETRKQILSGLIISIIVVSSSLSILMYISYTALALNHPTPEFNYMHGKRFFPSKSEFDLINFLRGNMNPKTDNIAVPEQKLEADTGGIFSQIQSFVGVPITKLVMSRSTLQESTLEGLYSLLDYTNTQFVVLQKKYINNNGLSDGLKFILDNFERAYENKYDVALSMPPLTPPTDDGDIALISPRSLHNYSIPFLISNRTLDYHKDFTILNRSLEKDRIVTVSGSTNRWSNMTEDQINYIEGRFRVIGDNKRDTHAGIVWRYGENIYQAFIRPDGGIFISTPSGKEFGSQSSAQAEAQSSRGAEAKWYTLKVVDMMNGKINIFLNDVLKVRVHKPFASASISNVGINSFNSIAQFEPIVIGTTQSSAAKSDIVNPQNGYYYSLTALALSKLKYSSFVEGDFSAFSKKNIILPFDPVDAAIYLDSAKKGKTIIVLNADKDFRGGFSNFLCLQQDKEKDFDSIESSVGTRIEVSGTARDIKTKCPGSLIKSFYMKGGQKAVPFTIEKEYGNGKIIFVNLLPYFASISTHPEKFFSTLKEIIPVINLEDQQYVSDTTLNVIPSTRFVGNLRISGHVNINSSSLLMPTDDFYSESISIRKQKEKDNQPLIYQSSSLSNKSDFSLPIRNLKIYGPYDASINSSNLSYLPTQSKSFSVPYGYIEFDLPVRSNISIKLDGKESSAEFFLGQDKVPIRVKDAVIEFKSVTRGNLSSSNINNINYSRNALDTSQTNMPILMKRPEVKSVNGSISFQELHSNNPHIPIRPWLSGVPLIINGDTTTLRLNHVNKDPDSITKFVTFFDWIEFHSNTDRISKKPIGSPLEIQWDEIISSDINARLVAVMMVLTALTIYIIWSNPNLKRKVIEHKRSPL